MYIRRNYFGDYENPKQLSDRNELNMRQIKQMKLFKDCDFKLHYHFRKRKNDNNALSLKSLHISINDSKNEFTIKIQRCEFIYYQS